MVCSAGNLGNAKYAAYAEPEAAAVLRAWPSARFARVVVIPAWGEGMGLWTALNSIAGPATLAILVLNCCQDAPAWVHHHNAQCRLGLRQRYGAGVALGDLAATTLFATAFGQLLLVDRACDNRYLPAGQGVGLARKIGCDIAWALQARGLIASPWLHCTDADVQLPADYFHQIAPATSAAAVVYRFAHVCTLDSPALAAAANAYETYLHAYVDGLRWAGSPYAFHTIGSTLAIHADAYAQVRGFPRRNAGEDFYVLNKLRKIGPVVSLQGTPIKLAARVSQRVPFGTGKALWRLITDPEAKLSVYHPDTYTYLRAWLQILAQAAHCPVNVAALCMAADVPRPPLLKTALDRLNGQRVVAQAHAKTRSAEPRLRYLHTWFDAFRTLKYVHDLRDLGLPMVPL